MKEILILLMVIYVYYIIIKAIIKLIKYAVKKSKEYVNNIKYNQQENMNYKQIFRKKDFLLTPTELKFYKLLKSITDKLGYNLFTQVSLYEIIQTQNHLHFNSIKSKSIDFVITQENCKILLCIELDDISHTREDRIKRDNFINKLFEELNIKLLRIPVQSFYNLEELEKEIKILQN